MRAANEKYPVKGSPDYRVERTFPSQGSVAQLVELARPNKGVPFLLVRKAWESGSDWDELETYKALENQAYFPKLYYWDQTVDTRVIFIEYCSGVCLDQTVINTSEAAKQMFSKLLSALKTLHDLNIVHRDIKPTNIFKNANDDFKIFDFGSALQVRQCRDLTVLSGNTLSYFCGKIGGMMATLSREEQIAVLKKRDVWALGKSLLECLAGSRALDFSRKNEGEVFKFVNQYLLEKWGDFIPILMQMLSYDFHKGADAGKLIPMLNHSLSLRSTSSSNSHESSPVKRPPDIPLFNGKLAIQRVRTALHKVETADMQAASDQLNRLASQPHLSRDPLLSQMKKLWELKQRGIFGKFRVQLL